MVMFFLDLIAPIRSKIELANMLDVFACDEATERLLIILSFLLLRPAQNAALNVIQPSDHLVKVQ